MGFIDSFQRMSVDELRDEAINLLKQAYADGRISVDTLERRLKDATTATDKESLISLVADIPAPAGGTASERRGTQAEKTWNENDRIPKDSQSFFAVLPCSP